MAKYITVSFPPKEDALLKRVKETCPKHTALAEHARDLMRDGLDATTCTPAARKK